MPGGDLQIPPMKNCGKNDKILRIKTLPFLNSFPGHHDWAEDRLSLPERGPLYCSGKEVSKADGRLDGLISGGVDSMVKELVFYLAPFQC
ncbi:hypothetical protein Y981_05830 [Leptospirillum ferriphilum YSK]|uniref:Uncharacterized protein n=1 Tax=Leptospirillum ferriphilum YSK TaxID=1441628 RepID=A0A059Y2H2_9BACT|nr:hypothetical protein Y981_05830 [Leptospirillum ferriphilum YSK]